MVIGEGTELVARLPKRLSITVLECLLLQQGVSGYQTPLIIL